MIAPTAQVLGDIAKYFEKVGESLAEQAIQRQLLKDGIGDTTGKNRDGSFKQSIVGQAFGGIFSKDPIVSGVSGGALTNIVIEALNINTQATDAQGVAEVTVKAIGNLANQTGH